MAIAEAKAEEEKLTALDKLRVIEVEKDNLRDQLELEKELSKNEAEKNAILLLKIEKL